MNNIAYLLTCISISALATAHALHLHVHEY